MDWLLVSAQDGYSLCSSFWLTVALRAVLRSDIPPSKVPAVRLMTDRCSSKPLVSVDACRAIANLRAQFNRWIDLGSRQGSRKRQKGERGPREKKNKKIIIIKALWAPRQPSPGLCSSWPFFESAIFTACLSAEAPSV